MRVISHRGFWTRADEKNQPVAFRRSFGLGFGTETDLRDRAGRIVISHDPADDGAMTLEDYLGIVRDSGQPDLLQALNIKADGLAQPLAAAMKGFEHPWFVFDMSVPDMVQHLKAGNPVYARMSEHEPFPETLQGRIEGIWLDAFDGTWFGPRDVESLLDRGLGVCIVSPELHRRADYADLWTALQPLRHHTNLTLCTDLPTEAVQALGLPLPATLT